MSDLRDSILLQQALEGDEQAWTTIVSRHGHAVYAIARWLGLGHEDAAEVTQSVWVALLQGGHRIKDPDALRAWLLTVTRRLAWRYRSRERIQSELDENMPSEEPTIEDLLVMEGRFREIREAMGELNEKCRVVLTTLFTSEGYRKAAETLGIPIGSIGPTRGRCLARLHEILKKRGFWE